MRLVPVLGGIVAAVAKRELEQWLPEFALVVTKPDHLDVNFHGPVAEVLAKRD